MPSKPREKEPDMSKTKDRSRHRSSKSTRKLSRDHDKTSTSLAHSSTITSPPTNRRTSMPMQELERKASSDPLNESKASLPYPSFSKAHSKEAVGSRENVANPRLSYYTPDPTDLDKENDNSINNDAQATTGVAPPSPPETTMNQKANVAATGADSPKTDRKRTDLQKAADELKRRLGRRSSDKLNSKKVERHSQPPKSRNSQRQTVKDEERHTPLNRSKPSTPSKLKPQPVIVDDAASTNPRRSPSPIQSTLTETATTTTSTIDSDATSVAPNQTDMQPPFVTQADDDSITDPDSSPRTPTLTEPQFPPSRKQTPAFTMIDRQGYSGSFQDSPLPPPPPPPPMFPFQVPKVDYLILNGGLAQSIPRTLLGAGQPAQGPYCIASSIPVQVDRFFAPFNNLLDDYTKVISRSGSLAVATGYRSIARRLLDRLEAVFCRDISSQTCTCIVCLSQPVANEDPNDQRGVSWGEILEYVCGRQELPQWPAFTLHSAAQLGLGISVDENRQPMQKLDIDVPEEFRDHYVRQSKKTKQLVDRWLASQPETPTSPPQDVDDETLTFAMLTRLEPEQRLLFSALLGVAPSRPASTTGTPLIMPTSDLLEKTGLAIQRLYRLTTPPRDPESAIYLLNNPILHNVLATLAAISDDEWEILTSGRFDGFLRSGAEDNTAQPSISRNPTPAARMTTPSSSFPHSRGTTPFARGPTPAAVGAPVAIDEETEIAVLAEVEREIYLGMEALEDAFEALHSKAETVRHALRERGAGLSMTNQSRNGGSPSANLDARMGTPSSNLGNGNGGWGSETDDGIDDGISELAPDDSASNVSRSRQRRPKRRNERRTPAPVEEEDEELT